MRCRTSWSRTTPVSTVRVSYFSRINEAELMPDLPRTVPPPLDPHPGRFVHHLDFTHFRTIGMRRSIEEGVTSRFVTGERLLAVLKVISTGTYSLTLLISIHLFRKCQTFRPLAPQSTWTGRSRSQS